jgi:hypothetical protein
LFGTYIKCENIKYSLYILELSKSKAKPNLPTINNVKQAGRKKAVAKMGPFSSSMVAI